MDEEHKKIANIYNVKEKLASSASDLELNLTDKELDVITKHIVYNCNTWRLENFDYYEFFGSMLTFNKMYRLNREINMEIKNEITR